MNKKYRIIETLPRAARVFKALSNIGYDFNSAIADLIDNSIDAKAKNIHVDLARTGRHAHFSLRDDGHGMSKSKLHEAMHFGSDRDYDEESLGKFGMGLKTASLSQCRRFTVASNFTGTVSGLNAFCWDQGHIERTNKWQLFELSRDDVQRDKRFKSILRNRGTIVCWEEMVGLDRDLEAVTHEGNAQNRFLDVITNLKLHTGMTFHRFLDGSLGPRRAVKIYCNRVKISPWDPFCRKEKHPQTFRSVSFSPEEGNGAAKYRIEIKPYVLPDRSKFSSEKAWNASKGLLALNDAQGLYVYRENRIIHFGGWLHMRGKNPHAAYARTAVDFSKGCDALFDVDVRKRNFRLPSSIYDKIKTVTAESVTSAIKLAGKSTPKDAGIHSKSAMPAGIAIAKTLDRYRVKIEDPADGRVKVKNHSGSFFLRREDIDDDALIDTPVIPGKVPEGGLWKVVPRANKKFAVILNMEHPFYRAVYDGSSSKLTKSVDAVILALGITKLCSFNEQSLKLCEEIRLLVSSFLADYAKAKGFVGKGNHGGRKNA